MGKRFVLFLSFGVVFALGFAAGVLWRPSFQLPVPSLHPILLHSTVPSAEIINLTEAEAQIAKALEDPDFKRIHDHLNQQRPMILEIPTKSATSQEQEKIPMSERPPVRFMLD